jgi:hypothetical protein
MDGMRRDEMMNVVYGILFAALGVFWLCMLHLLKLEFGYANIGIDF